MKRHCCNHYATITRLASDVELILNTPREKKRTLHTFSGTWITVGNSVVVDSWYFSVSRLVCRTRMQLITVLFTSSRFTASSSRGGATSSSSSSLLPWPVAPNIEPRLVSNPLSSAVRYRKPLCEVSATERSNGPAPALTPLSLCEEILKSIYPLKFKEYWIDSNRVFWGY